MVAMTRDEFIQYANQALDPENLEGLHEMISEHNGEVTRFGDSWPGALVQIHRQVAEIRQIERQLARLEGRAPHDFQFRILSPR